MTSVFTVLQESFFYYLFEKNSWQNEEAIMVFILFMGSWWLETSNFIQSTNAAAAVILDKNMKLLFSNSIISCISTTLYIHG